MAEHEYNVSIEPTEVEIIPPETDSENWAGGTCYYTPIVSLQYGPEESSYRTGNHWSKPEGSGLPDAPPQLLETSEDCRWIVIGHPLADSGAIGPIGPWRSLYEAWEATGDERVYELLQQEYNKVVGLIETALEEYPWPEAKPYTDDEPC